MPTIVSSIIAAIVALGLTVFVGIFVLPEKKRIKQNKLFGILSDIFTFRDLLLDKILTFLYTFCTLLCVSTGVFFLVTVEYSQRYSWYYDRYETSAYYMGGWGILILILGPIAVRIIFEILMMFVLLVKNTISINNKLNAQPGSIAEIKATSDAEKAKRRAEESAQKAKKKAEAAQAQLNAQPQQPQIRQPQQTYVPNVVFCTNCGTRYDANQGGCPNGCQQHNN